MKKGFYIGVVIVLQIAILVKIGQLEKELNNTKNYITNKLRDQSSEIMSLYSNMEQKLKADNSLIENFDYSYGNVDYQGHIGIVFPQGGGYGKIIAVVKVQVIGYE